MGRNQESTTITVQLSAHNDEQDEVDAALWEELRGRVDKIVKDERYEGIRPSIY